MLINPNQITNFYRNDAELEAFWLFCIMVAGKNADQTAKKLAAMLSNKPAEQTPFDYLNSVDIDALIKLHKIGQYNRIGQAIKESLMVDLRNAPLSEFLKIKGVGPKTSRFFILHSRRNSNVAVLDVHILRYMKELSFWENVPSSTPQNPNVYGLWEQRFIKLCGTYWPHLSIAEVDLMIWKTQRA